MLEIGTLIDGKYKILDIIGHGGMSTVYLAINERANKTWAVKEVRKGGKNNSSLGKYSLVVEKNILTKLHHDNLPSIIDVIDTEDSILIIMDYIPGESLDKVLKKRGKLPQSKVIEWGIQLCKVLYYLHSQNPPIIYRDMKPANVMLLPENKGIKLIDFGTAREFKEYNSMDTISLGTPEYAAPEQQNQRRTDARTDIYCLGATLYHLVTGQIPNHMVPICQIDSTLSDELERILIKCTQHDPKDRYQSVDELWYDLSKVEDNDKKKQKEKKRKFAAFATTLFLTVIFAGISIWGYISAEKKRQENYDYIIANAADVSDYYSAILTSPERTEAYLGGRESAGLIAFITDDGEMDAEDNAVISKLKAGLDETDTQGYTGSVDVLGKLRASNYDGYQDVCFEIGEAYLFYYNVDVEKDKYSAAASWFQYAQEKYPIAKIYCDVSSCLQNIAKYSKAEQITRMYDEYETLWSQINTLRNDANGFDDDLKLMVWNEIATMIRNNAKEFCEVIDKNKLLNLLDAISMESAKISNSYLQSSIEKLNENIATTEIKINSVAVGDER